MYYSGHGVEVDGQNWLLPVGNAAIQTQADVPIYSVSAQDVLRKVEEGGARLNLLILDACRDNPLPAGAKSASRGLARIDTGTSTLVAYATAPGRTASDGDGRNSPYTAVLKGALKAPGLSVTDLLNQVGAQVQTSSGGAQIPWNSGTPIWPPIFLAGEAAVASTTTSLPLAREGELRIEVSPASAQVRVDGALVTDLSNTLRLPTGKAVVISAQADGYETVEERVLILGGQISPVVLRLKTGKHVEPAVVVQPALGEAEAYASAFEMLKNGRYPDAGTLFSDYIQSYPSGINAANATYWLGETYYVSKKYQIALDTFQRLLKDFPDSLKAPDALLKVGYCQYELNDMQRAATALREVIARFPETTVARLAQGRLRAIELGGN